MVSTNMHMKIKYEIHQTVWDIFN